MVTKNSTTTGSNVVVRAPQTTAPFPAGMTILPVGQTYQVGKIYQTGRFIQTGHLVSGESPDFTKYSCK